MDPFDFDGGDVDWRGLLQGLWRRKWLVLLGLVLGAGAGFFLAERTEPTYETQATLWLEATDDQSGPIQGADVLEGQGWSDLLLSFSVLEPVVRNFRLYLRPASNEAPADSVFRGFRLTGDGEQPVTGRYRVALSEDGESVRLLDGEGREVGRAAPGEALGEALGFRWSPPVDRLRSGGDITFSLTSVPGAAARLRDRLSVAFNPRSGNLINTHLTWPDPQEAARIHNAVVDTFMSTAYSLKSQKLREVVSILEQQTDYTANRLEAAELELENFRVSTVTLPSERSPSSSAPGIEATRDPVFQSYFQKRLDIDELQSRIDRFSDLLAAAEADNLDPMALQLAPGIEESPALQSALQELFDKEARRRTLLRELTPANPRVRELEEDISALRTETIPEQLRAFVQQLEARRQQLRTELQRQASELREVPTRSITEARLRREVQMAEELHNNLLVRLNEAELAASTALPDLQVVDRAFPPGQPTSNGAARLFLMASLAGLGLGVAGAILRDRMDDTVRDPEELSRELGLQILGAVPDLNRLDSDDPAAAEVIEAFRSIRVQLDQLPPGKRSTVVITSPAPREGKSLLSGNLALAYAASGRRTLLIDADTRRGDLAGMFSTPGSPGLIEALSGDVAVADALHDTDTEGLWVLPRGSRRSFSPERLESGRMDEIFRELENVFDAIVVDTPPLEVGSDALVVARHADKVVLVVRPGTTERELLKRKLESADIFGVPVVGTVLNDVSPRESYYRYYGAGTYPYDEESVPAEEVQVLPAS